MKELVVISGKGGTGKTSVLAAMASMATNAVVVDCDVDAANLHVLLNPQIQRRFDFYGGKIATIVKNRCTSCGICRDLCRFDAITPDYQVDAIACEGCGVCVWNCPENAIEFKEHKNGEWYISQTRFGDMVHAKLGIAEENSGKLVTMVRNEAQKLAQKYERDLLLVDGPPGIGCPVIAAITGADAVLIVVEPTRSAMHDMERVIQLARHFHIPVSIVINKYDLQMDLTTKIRALCQREKLDVVGEIPYDLDLVRAQMNGKTIVEYTDGNLRTCFVELWNTVQRHVLNRLIVKSSDHRRECV
ncbi:(4Fe-4S)-binding protein [candidate division KSB1 bacterium]|nr:ATP-binding protein [candidate division KSB1 bacterium]RQW00321.1 MAG: (4Fe-4S)-binding protein [candidate division KSB1 bacterium]